MSAPGPDSIPTSADPRSHRPTKKRATTPLSAQAASVEALFAKPHQDIRIDQAKRGAASTVLPAPPEIVTNVQGSSAGAGSGEFHVYKAARRREYERQRAMDEDVRRERDAVEFEQDKSERDRRDEEKTRKNRERREKMKARKAKKGKDGGAAAAAAAGGGGGGSNGKVVQKTEAATTRGADGDASTAQQAPNGDSGAAQASKSSSESAGLVIHDDD